MEIYFSFNDFSLTSRVFRNELNLLNRNNFIPVTWHTMGMQIYNKC